MIAIGSPLDLRRKLGMVAVEMQVPENGTRYRYFQIGPRLLSSSRRCPALKKWSCGVDLEDVFIELTGQKVTGD